MNDMNNKELVEQHLDFLQEQLEDAQSGLFFARSVREVKFLQSKIAYLKTKVKEMKKRRK